MVEITAEEQNKVKKNEDYPQLVSERIVSETSRTILIASTVKL